MSNLSDESLDPDIAALLGVSEDVDAPTQTKKESSPSLPVDIANQNEFLQVVVDSENEEMKEAFLKIKLLFEQATNKDEKGAYREKLGVVYWNFYRSLAPKVMGELQPEKRLSLRFNLLDLSYISKSQLDMIKSIPLKTESDSVFYLDEWLNNVGNNKIDQSVVDETKVAKKREGAAASEKLERKQGQRDAEIQLIKGRIDQIKQEETHLKQLTEEVQHGSKSVFLSDKKQGFLEPYSNEQRESLSQIVETCKSLSKSDKELRNTYKIINDIEESITKLEEEVGGDIDSDESNTIVSEFNTVKQMIKMSVGRQGNHFPILLERYFSDDINQVASKKNVENVIQEVEKFDPGLFLRAYKGENHRVVPYIVLIPCYGEVGVCWDPIPKNNRATGKGRIAIPIFPKNLKTAIISALSDLRWQVAKEKAQHYWMEEGLTGEYYQYYQSEKLKGDIRKFFIQDYILWITWETQGIQKLHKDVRPVFWRHIPFPQETKDVLKNKGFYYSELYEKDKRRERSVGY